jgi:hypothetical protein
MIVYLCLEVGQNGIKIWDVAHEEECAQQWVKHENKRYGTDAFYYQTMCLTYGQIPEV